MEYITMRNGTKVPMLGLGCYKSEEQEGVEAVKSVRSEEHTSELQSQ